MKANPPILPLPSAQKTFPPVNFNDKIILSDTSVKYLGLHLDKRLTWATHIKTKRKFLNIRLNKPRQLRSKISLENKMLIYKPLIRPAMTYGIQLWGCTKISNLKIFQAFQSINLCLH
jgi:hypothetical protein